MSSRLFPNAEAWSSFLTDSRKTVVQSVLQLDKALTGDNTEFWGWKKIDASTQRASFRAPANQKTALLSASGVRVNFIIQDLCRNPADVDDRDKSCAVVWLGRRTYGESFVLWKQVVGNFGFALNSQSFGIRVKPTELSAIRSLVAPTKFSAPNLSVRGSMRYTITGLPSGCSRSEMVKRFAEWNWPVIPLEHWISGGQSHWLVGCDKAPPEHFYLMRAGRALIEGAQENQRRAVGPRSAKCRTSAPPRQVSQPSRQSALAPTARARSQGPPNAVVQTSTDTPSNDDLLARIVALETRQKLSERQKTLEEKVGSGIAAILARLDAQADRCSSPARRSHEGHAGETQLPKSHKAS